MSTCEFELCQSILSYNSYKQTCVFTICTIVLSFKCRSMDNLLPFLTLICFLASLKSSHKHLNKTI